MRHYIVEGFPEQLRHKLPPSLVLERDVCIICTKLTHQTRPTRIRTSPSLTVGRAKNLTNGRSYPSFRQVLAGSNVYPINVHLEVSDDAPENGTKCAGYPELIARKARVLREFLSCTRSRTLILGAPGVRAGDSLGPWLVLSEAVQN